MTQREKVTARLETLLRDYGYRFTGDTLISKPIRGFTSAEVVGRFKGITYACEYLIPRIREDEFQARYNAAMAG